MSTSSNSVPPVAPARFEPPIMRPGSLSSRLQQQAPTPEHENGTGSMDIDEEARLNVIDLDPNAPTVDADPSRPVTEEEAAAFANFTTTNPDYRMEHTRLYIHQFEIDPRVQRPRRERHINNMARNWTLAAVGTVTASVRTNPTTGEKQFILLDGQQRLAAGVKAGYTGLISVNLHYGLDLSQEALLFRLHNNKESVSTLDKFRVSLLEGNQSNEGRISNAIEDTLRDLGIERSPKGFNAVSMAVRIVKYNNGLTAFRWALEVIQKAFKGRPDSSSSIQPTAVEALALLFLAHGNLIQRDRMITKLAEGARDEFELINGGRSRQRVERGTLTPNVINEIIRHYNKGLKAGGGKMIPRWDVKQRGPR